jgi:hypothetical protein
MSKKFQLQIPEPCHEDWNKMNPGDKGRFCDSCQKTVHDFTGMSDMQLIAFFKKPSTGSVCGRFYNDQLERDFEIPRKRIPWLKYFFQLTIPVFLTGLKSYSQGKPFIKEKNDSSVCTNINSDEIFVMGQRAIPVVKNEIFGRVVDENGKGIPYASITVKGSKEGVMCDSTGFFQLEISTYEKKATLIVSSIGYSEQERQIELKKTDSVEIALSTNATLSGEVVVTAYGVTRTGKMTLGSTSIRMERISYLQKAKDYFLGDSIKVFPNPVKAGGQIKIEWKKAETSEYKIDLYGLQGQLVKSSLARIENEINVFAFQIPIITPGSYMLQMTNKKSGKKHSEKIIIQ